MNINKKRLSLLLVVMLLISILAGCSPASNVTEEAPAPSEEPSESSTAPTSENPLVFKLSHVFSTPTPMHTSLVTASENIKKRTNGAIDIEVFAGGTLPYGVDGVEQVVRGSNFISVYDPSVLADWVPDFMAIGGPFLVSTRDEFKQLCESDLALELSKQAEDQGIKVLALPFNFGMRQIASGKIKVDSLDDLKNIKMRIPSSQLWVKTFEALGCNTIVTPSSEVYNAIQTGVADANESSISDLANMQMQEVLKYITITNHFIGTSSAVMSNEVFNSLSPEQQDIMLEEFKAAADVCSEEFEQAGIIALDVMKDAGVEIIEGIDITPFKEATKVVYSQETFPDMSPDIYERIQEELEKIRSN